MPTFMPWQPVFESEAGRSTLIHEILPTKVTIRHDPPFRTCVTPYGETPPARHDKTMFHQIKMLPPSASWGSEIKEFISSPPPRKRVKRKEFLSRTFEVFLNVVEAAWIPSKFHIVLHSGGYDSRLISYAIRTICQKNGPEWLGDLLFLEVQGEHQYSWAALEAEGWGKAQFVIYRDGDGQTTTEYYSRCCDFADAWKRQNCGMFAKAFSHWYEPIEWLQETGYVPSDDNQLQCWSGYFANDIAHALINGLERSWTKSALDWIFRALPYHPYFLAPIKGEWVMPYLSFDLIKVLWKCGAGQQESQEQSYRRHVLEWQSPDVAKIRNPQRGIAQSSLSLRLQERMIQSYHDSWYGQEVAPDVKPKGTIEFGTWWGHFGLASFCEEIRLRRKQHRVRYLK